MRTSGVSHRTAARLIAQTGERPSSLSRGQREGQGNGPSRYEIGAGRRRDHRGGAQASQRRSAPAPWTRNRASGWRGGRNRETAGAAFDGLRAREGEHRVSNSQHASESAYEDPTPTGLHRSSPRPRDLRSDDVRKESNGTGHVSAELEGRH